MKKILPTLYTLLVFSSLAFSQTEGVRIGPRFGIGESAFLPLPGLKQRPTLAWDAGVSFSNQFNSSLGLQTDFLFCSRGAEVSSEYSTNSDQSASAQSFTESYKLVYAQIPVLLKLSIGEGSFHFKAFGGPALDVNLSMNKQERIYSDQTYNAKNGFNVSPTGIEMGELSAVYGLGIELEALRGKLLFVDFRMNTGLTPLGQIDGHTAFNNCATLHIGCMFK
jgi:hypothetical protein